MREINYETDLKDISVGNKVRLDESIVPLTEGGVDALVTLRIPLGIQFLYRSGNEFCSNYFKVDKNDTLDKSHGTNGKYHGSRHKGLIEEAILEGLDKLLQRHNL